MNGIVDSLPCRIKISVPGNSISSCSGSNNSHKYLILDFHDDDDDYDDDDGGGDDDDEMIEVIMVLMIIHSVSLC